MFIQQMDVKGAYLNGILEETIFMTQPEGYGDATERICQLIKTLYGLKQAGRCWNFEFDRKMRRHGYKRLLSDPCAYIRRDGDEIAIVTVWVDDLLLFATSMELMEKMKSDLRKEWQITDLGEPSKIVGIEIMRRKDSISISQRGYIEKILREEGMERCNPVAMPLDPNVKIEPNPDGNQGDRSNSYARLIGELQFISNATRPDIAYAVNRLAAYTANPSLQHSGMLKRILRYLAGTKDYAITYLANPRVDHRLQGYADASFAGTESYQSVSGYVFTLGSGAISWKSKKLKVITLSSTEAEYVALSEAAHEAIWLKNLLTELGLSQKTPVVIKGDNDGSIAMAKNPLFHNRSKHIAIKWHWMRQAVQNGQIYIEDCQDADQTADVLTKPLPRAKHRQHSSEMGLSPN
jgi:hypothetical protein